MLVVSTDRNKLLLTIAGHAGHYIKALFSLLYRAWKKLHTANTNLGQSYNETSTCQKITSQGNEDRHGNRQNNDTRKQT